MQRCKTRRSALESWGCDICGMLLGDDLDSGNGCVIMDWDEFQHELALCVGLQAADLAHERATFAGLLKNIEVAQDELAIAEHVEGGAFLRSLGSSKAGRGLRRGSDAR